MPSVSTVWGDRLRQRAGGLDDAYFTMIYCLPSLLTPVSSTPIPPPSSPLRLHSTPPPSLPLPAVKIMKTRNNRVKFKVRCSRYLYTLVVTDKEKAEKLKQSLPPGEAHHDFRSCPHGIHFFPPFPSPPPRLSDLQVKELGKGKTPSRGKK